MRPEDTTSYLTVLRMRDEIDRLELFGACPAGHIRRSRTSDGPFGHLIPEIYCPTCEGVARRRVKETVDLLKWEVSVQARLNEALVHLAHGLEARWDHLPCAKYPFCLDRLGAGWPALPQGYKVTGASDEWRLYRNSDGTVTEVVIPNGWSADEPDGADG